MTAAIADDADALGNEARLAVRRVRDLTDTDPVAALEQLRMTLSQVQTQTGQAVRAARTAGLPEVQIRRIPALREGEAYAGEFRLG